jgi:hypothetical protein
MLDEEGRHLLPKILAEWSAWTEMRQNHLAYILGEGHSPMERKILSDMAQSGSLEVAFTARESLRSNYPKDA